MDEEMRRRERYDAGAFCWVGLATSDPVSAEAFYRELFGWSGESLAAGSAGVFTVFRHQSEDVAILYRQTVQARAAAAPPHWTSFISADDVHATASRAAELGGSVAFREPFDVGDAGRIAAIRDPGGGNLSVWEPRTRLGATIVNEVGAFCWNELATGEVERAKTFFRALFDWTYESGDAGYTVIKTAGRRIGAIRPREQAPEMSPGWTPFFKVESTDEAVRRAERLGGRILVQTARPPLGRLALIADPQAASFGVVEKSSNDLGSN
jgi:predicted enzyme related to lactoylglutathione lyase